MRAERSWSILPSKILSEPEVTTVDSTTVAGFKTYSTPPFQRCNTSAYETDTKKRFMTTILCAFTIWSMGANAIIGTSATALAKTMRRMNTRNRKIVKTTCVPRGSGDPEGRDTFATKTMESIAHA